MKKILALIYFILICSATCSVSLVFCTWLVPRGEIPLKVYIEAGVIGAVVGCWGGAGIWLMYFLEVRKHHSSNHHK